MICIKFIIFAILHAFLLIIKFTEKDNKGQLFNKKDLHYEEVYLTKTDNHCTIAVC